jgi:hypothetical protein
MWSATHPLGLSNTSSGADVIGLRRYRSGVESPIGAAEAPAVARPAFMERRTVDGEATPFPTGEEDTHGIASFRNPLECGVQCHPIDVISTLGRALAWIR